MTTNTNTTTTVITSKESFIRAEEVCETLDISRAYAYRIIKQLNTELTEKGYMTIDGRTSRKYFNERFYRKMW